MKQYRIAILSTSFILFLGSFSVAAGLQEGFMKYKWGENISQHEELTKLYPKGILLSTATPVKYTLLMA